MVNAAKIVSALVSVLSPRQKEVLLGRFGLDRNAKSQTLAALGNRYGVTRERVRQIEASALRALRDAASGHPAAVELTEKLAKYLKENGGVARRERFLEYARSVADGLTENHLALFREASAAFSEYPEDKHFWSFYYLNREGLRAASSFIEQWVSFVRSRKAHVLGGKYEEHFEKFIRNRNAKKQHGENYLSISRKLGANSYGDRGLTEWAEIHPRTIRDRIYLVMKKKGKPLHFRIVADFVNQHDFPNRRASPPTVHNELIKDERFVLVGRGMYALAEHGYEPGTAREVIKRTLKKHGALKPKELIQVISEERFFKPNTILVNLQNKQHFRRLPNGTYTVREA